MPPAQHASVIYMEEMQSLQEGTALWFPEPHSSGEIQIGDVGYIDDGAFIRLFNAISPDRYPVLNSEGCQLPDKFEPLKPPQTRIGDHRPKALVPGFYPSENVERKSMDATASVGDLAQAALEYACTKERGALLVLGNFATKDLDPAQKHFKRYAAKHYDSWYKFATERAGLNKPQLILVRGTVKTTLDWTTAAYANSGRAGKGSIGAGIPGYRLTATIASQQYRQGPTVTRSGRSTARASDDRRSYSASSSRDPPSRSTTAVHDQNSAQIASEDNGSEAESTRFDQSLFIKGCYVKHRRLTSALNWIRMRAGAGPDKRYNRRNESPNRDSPAIPVERVEEGRDAVDETVSYSRWVMNALLDYILERSDASIAVCCEEDIEYRLLGQDWPEDIAQWLLALAPPVDIDTHGVGTLSLEEAIRTRRKYYVENGIAFDDVHRSTPRRPRWPRNTPRKEASLPAAALETGELVLGSRLDVALEWPHLLFQDEILERGFPITMATSSHAKYIAITRKDSSITLWDVPQARAISRLEGHADLVEALAFSTDGTRLVSGDKNAITKVWDISSPAAPYEVHTLQVSAQDLRSVSVWCSFAVFSPDDKMVVTTYTNSSVRIWDAEDGTLLRTLESSKRTSHIIVFSPDSRYLVSCVGGMGLICNMGIQADEAEIEMVGHSGQIWCMCVSNDGHRIVTSSTDKTARVWDIHTGDEMVAIRWHRNIVSSVSFSPDDVEVATASYDGTVAICDSHSGARRHLFHHQQKGSNEIVRSVAYSRSGSLLASGTEGGIVRLWDVKAGSLVAEFRGHKVAVYSLVFTQDDSDVISFSTDGTLRMWNVYDALQLY